MTSLPILIDLSGFHLNHTSYRFPPSCSRKAVRRRLVLSSSPFSDPGAYFIYKAEIALVKFEPILYISCSEHLIPNFHLFAYSMHVFIPFSFDVDCHGPQVS